MNRMSAVALGALIIGSLAIYAGWSFRSRSWDLRPGRYRLTLVATFGSRQSNSVTGDIVLVEAEPVPGQPSTRNTPLRGWTDIDMHRVGAPLCDGQPQPSSRDAVHTGVLVLKLDPGMRLDPRVPHRHDAPILVTGTPTNIRDGRPRLDGCGIGLFVQERLMGCQSGEWVEWGLERDGRGTFSLCG